MFDRRFFSFLSLALCLQGVCQPCVALNGQDEEGESPPIACAATHQQFDEQADLPAEPLPPLLLNNLEELDAFIQSGQHTASAAGQTRRINIGEMATTDLLNPCNADLLNTLRGIMKNSPHQFHLAVTEFTDAVFEALRTLPCVYSLVSSQAALNRALQELEDKIQAAGFKNHPEVQARLAEIEKLQPKQP